MTSRRHWQRACRESMRRRDDATFKKVSDKEYPSLSFPVCNHSVHYCAHQASIFRSCAPCGQDGRAGGAPCLFIFVESSFVSSSLHEASGWGRSGSQPPRSGVPTPGGVRGRLGEIGDRTRWLHLFSFIARSTSRLASRVLMDSRRSCCFLPLANPISTLARPRLEK